MENTVKIKGLDICKLLEGTVDSITVFDENGNPYTVFKKDIEGNIDLIVKQIKK